MTKVSPDVFSATAGEVIQITVQSVGFVINADLDPKLKPVGPVNDFSKAGQLTMGNADTTFVVGYNFPTPLPAGGKYTRTITGPSGFTDGPFDVLQPGNENNVTLPYVIEFVAAGAGGGK
jgi:hypothetical protein